MIPQKRSRGRTEKPCTQENENHAGSIDILCTQSVSARMAIDLPGGDVGDCSLPATGAINPCSLGDIPIHPHMRLALSDGYRNKMEYLPGCKARIFHHNLKL